MAVSNVSIGQNLANHARGGNQNLLGLAADDLRCDAACLARACKAGLTRGGVGIARVDRNAGDDTVALGPHRPGWRGSPVRAPRKSDW